jgi:aminopeptidase N
MLCRTDMNQTLRTAMMTVGLLSAAMPRLGADTYPRQAGVTITRYAFDVTLSDTTSEIVVRETVDVRFTAPGVTGVDLDLCGVNPARAPRAAVDPCVGARSGGGGSGVGSGAGAGRAGGAAPSPGGGGLSGSANETGVTTGMAVSEVVADGMPVRFAHRDDRLHIDLPRPSEVGAAWSFAVTYRGTPATGLQIGNNRYGDRGFFSNDWPDLARNWLATIDHPSMKAATAMTVTAPRKYQVISNGRLVEATDLPDDRRRTSWREDTPIPTWQISLGVAPFAVAQFGTVRGVPLSAWVYPQDRDDSFKGFGDATQPIFEFFSDRIGPYSYDKLAQVEATTVGGGMELASDIFYGYRGVPGRQLVAHEMAHQWFGDSATERDWDDVWLSEGFATYFALLYQEHADGRDAFLDGVRRGAQGAMAYALAHPTSTIVHENLADISKVIANNAQIYQGGAQVLHMLRGVLGDDRFWSGIRVYYSRYRNGNASSDDFRRAIEDACRADTGCPAEDKDLSWFFPEWLNRGGVLQLAGHWRYDAAAKQIEVTLDQTQTSGLYRMPIEVSVTVPPSPAGSPPPAATGRRGGGAGPTTTVVKMWIDQAHNTMTIPVTAEPNDVQLDPHVWVTMMQATFGKQ